MTKTHARRFPAVALACLVLLGLAGLGGGASCRGRGSAGRLTILLEKRIETFDPRVSSDSAAERLRQLMFNALTRKDEQFNPIPDLAERFEASPDRRSFTFHLRPGVKFHDDRPVSSLDVKYTFDSMMAKGFASAKKVELAREIAAIEVIDPQTILFRCANPCPNLPNMIVPVGIIPEGSTDQFTKRPIGTGPFKLESYTEDQEVILTANRNYFEGAPSIDRISIRITPDNSTRESELRKGSADLAINADFDPVTVEGLRKTPGIKVGIIDGTNITHLGINLTDPILKDKRVRQALAYGIDRDAIIRDVLRGQAKPARGILPPSQWAFEPNVAAYGYDPDRARRLLDEAGKPEINGRRVRLTLKTSTLSIARKIGEALQEQMRKIGVDLELLPLERQKLTQDMTDGNFQLYLNQLVGGNQSPDILKFVYSAKSIPPNGQNRSRYNNPMIDKLLDEAPMAPPERAREIFSQIQKILADELPQIYLWHPSTIVVHRDRVGEIKLDPSGDWRVIRAIKLR
ncbi:MAG: ABC transporter substrate-binding protein [Blastocatellia bacterium]